MRGKFWIAQYKSHPDSREGVRCETRPIEINRKILGRAWQQDARSVRETRRRLSLSLQWGHEGHICEVLQEDGCSSMYNWWLRILSVKFRVLYWYALYDIEIDSRCWLLFIWQVKNKPWLPWVYTWIWHCHEQLLQSLQHCMNGATNIKIYCSPHCFFYKFTNWCCKLVATGFLLCARDSVATFVMC
jgi:hypothetical protein